MVGLHIRQCDSVFHDDYYAPPTGPDTRRDYFPVRDSRELVRILRDLTHAPIIAGGFGFTTHSRKLYEHLELDYGVEGDPDDLFAHFDEVIRGERLDSVRGLIHRDPATVHVNERGYYSPFEDIEYTDSIFEEMVRFYGHAKLFGHDPPTVAVEVMRGCPFKCFFCTEPHVKGRKLRYRDLDVVEAELEGLIRRQIFRFWLICSELDIQGMKFGLSLAERMIRLRERHGVNLEWSAYALPRLSTEDLRTLQRSGYVGALNDVLSLDDTNLRRAKVPYRSKQAVGFLKAVMTLDREDSASAANAASAEGKVRGGLTQQTPKELASVLGLFLGNAHATISTIPNTLRRIDEEGLHENYRMALAFPATRVFEIEGEPICEFTSRSTRSFGPGGERDLDLIHPTFYYPDFLMERLKSPAAIIEFLRYVAQTFMSTRHRAGKDWPSFLVHHTSHEELEQLVAGAGSMTDPAAGARQPDRAGLRRLLAPPPGVASPQEAAKQIVDHIVGGHPVAASRVRTALRLPDHELTEYRLTEAVYSVADTRDQLVARVEPTSPAERFYMEWLLYTNNVVLRPEYRELLFGVDE